MWLSLLCASNRPKDLDRWLDSLYYNCVDPKGIQLSLTLESTLEPHQLDRWGDIVITYVKPKEYNINELTNICYQQSTASYIFLSGDDTICRTKNWDKIFKDELQNYKDDVILLYPNDLIFGNTLACYPVTTRLIMDMALPVPFKRYAIDDTIFDIVPRSRRVYFENVIMEHMHLVDKPPGQPVMRDGKQMYYPINEVAMAPDRKLYDELKPGRDTARLLLEKKMSYKAVKEAKVMICVPTGEMVRRPDFYDYFNALEKPDGTMLAFAHGQSPARNRNIMIKTALGQNATHCLFVDDDVAVKPDLLARLLRHDLDIVSGIYLQRNFPHQPIMFDDSFADGKCQYAFLTPGKKGLMEVHNVGLGCCLIKTEVFRKMEQPWIRLGELELDHWSDDIGFFLRARKAGFKIFVDLEIQCGHMGTATFWPKRDDDGNWFTVYDTSGNGQIQVPQVFPTQEQIDEQKRQEGYALVQG